MMHTATFESAQTFQFDLTGFGRAIAQKKQALESEAYIYDDHAFARTEPYVLDPVMGAMLSLCAALPFALLLVAR
jgi:hypothetical protein